MNDSDYSNADARLVRFLQQQINTGRRTVRIPAWLLDETTENGLAEARRLAKLCGCSIEVEA